MSQIKFRLQIFAKKAIEDYCMIRFALSQISHDFYAHENPFHGVPALFVLRIAIVYFSATFTHPISRYLFAAEETVSFGLDLEEKSAIACTTEDSGCDDDGSFARKSDIGLNLQLHLPPGFAPYTNLNHFNRQPLYGGRMTHSKLQQVGRVTKDAIETLHRYVLLLLLYLYFTWLH